MCDIEGELESLHSLLQPVTSSFTKRSRFFILRVGRKKKRVWERFCTLCFGVGLLSYGAPLECPIFYRRVSLWLKTSGGSSWSITLFCGFNLLTTLMRSIWQTSTFIGRRWWLRLVWLVRWHSWTMLNWREFSDWIFIFQLLFSTCANRVIRTCWSSDYSCNLSYIGDQRQKDSGLTHEAP